MGETGAKLRCILLEPRTTCAQVHLEQRPREHLTLVKAVVAHVRDQEMDAAGRAQTSAPDTIFEIGRAHV